jgi:hypothetical protein
MTEMGKMGQKGKVMRNTKKRKYLVVTTKKDTNIEWQLNEKTVENELNRIFNQ